MKLIAESYVGEAEETKVSIEISDGSDIYDVMRVVMGLLTAVGFAQESVLNGCDYLLQEYEYKRKDEDEDNKQI